MMYSHCQMYTERSLPSIILNCLPLTSKSPQVSQPECLSKIPCSRAQRPRPPLLGPMSPAPPKFRPATQLSTAALPRLYTFSRSYTLPVVQLVGNRTVLTRDSHNLNSYQKHPLYCPIRPPSFWILEGPDVKIQLNALIMIGNYQRRNLVNLGTTTELKLYACNQRIVLGHCLKTGTVLV